MLTKSEFDELQQYIIEKTNNDCELKRERLNKKFLRLKNEKLNTEKTKFDNINSKFESANFVKNLSSQSFNDEEMSILQKGLKFSPKPKSSVIIDIVADIETAIKFCKETEKQEIRETTKLAIEKTKSKKYPSPKSKRFDHTVKMLKEKDCLYMKSDKGRDIVIMDKSDYKQKVLNTITTDNFKLLNKDPLPSMIRATSNVLKEVESVFDTRTKWKLMPTNPSVPKLYCLPKTHKDTKNLKMRPIVSNCNAPSENIAKWLVDTFNNYPKPQSLCVQNCFEFCDKMREERIEDDELLVSFDVVSLFPSIPIPDTLLILGNWLEQHEPIIEKRELLIKLTKLCMDQNICQFDGSFYNITKGTCMGNALSPFLANIFMSHFEVKMKEEKTLPRTWWRYVDDVAAIIKKGSEQQILNNLNSKWPTIKFTIEIENNGTLPFLDVCLTRQLNGSIEFSVYRKPSNTPCYIPADSHCPMSHKKAAFHSMVYRLCKLPLNIKNYMDELKHIKYIASVNGYPDKMINNLVKLHSKKISKLNSTTLTNENNPLKRISLPYYPEITNKLKKVFKKHKFKIVHSTNNKLQNSIVQLKDKTDFSKKSGIYEISCSECDQKYIGQTKRNIGIRFKEHLASVNKKQSTKSAVAQHAIENNHLKWDLNNIKLKKQIHNPYKLDAYESIYMYLNRNTSMNTMEAPIISQLFKSIELTSFVK